MPPSSQLVSIGVPLRNGEKVIDKVLTSVTSQTYENLEIIVSDNDSVDGTEQLAKEWVAKIHEFATTDSLRIWASTATLPLSWVSLPAATSSGWAATTCSSRPDVERCTGVMSSDPALLLVTTQQSFTECDGAVRTASYDGTGLRSADKVERLAEMLRLLNRSHLLIDPMYGLMRREPATAIPLKAMLRGDRFSRRGSPWPVRGCT